MPNVHRLSYSVKPGKTSTTRFFMTRSPPVPLSPYFLIYIGTSLELQFLFKTELKLIVARTDQIVVAVICDLKIWVTQILQLTFLSGHSTSGYLENSPSPNLMFKKK